MAVTTDGAESLAAIANDLRELVVATLCHTQAGHPGGSLSAAEILTALFFGVHAHRPGAPRVGGARPLHPLQGPRRARLLRRPRRRRGYFPEELLQTYDELDSPLQAHPDMHCPGVDMSSGSLGQGLSAGLGMALGARLAGLPSRIYVLLGDGELQEGQVWEAAMAAAKFGADNLTAIVDDNRIQLMGDTARDHAGRPARREVARLQLARARGRRPRRRRHRGRLRRRRAQIKGQPHGDPRPHRQGQGRLLHGEHASVALGPGHRGAEGAGPGRALRAAGGAR